MNPEVAKIVFQGSRGAREKLADEVLRRIELDSGQREDVSWQELEEIAPTLHKDVPRRSEIQLISYDPRPLKDALDCISSKADVTGSGPFHDLMRRLNHSEWLNHGRKLLDEAGGVCPFCLQSLPDNFGRDLNETLASSFDAIRTRADEAADLLEAAFRRVESGLEQLDTRDGRMLGDGGAELIGQVRERIALNRTILGEKRVAPTRSFELADLGPLVGKLNALIDVENIEIEAHNKRVGDIAGTKKWLIEAGWSLFLGRGGVKNAVSQYLKTTSGATRAIESLKDKISSINSQIASSEEEEERLRQSVSNSLHVARRINSLLKGMGFSRFSLESSEQVPGGYQIVRSDGSLAVGTLSEGERSFIAFAYFWESLSGVTSAGGTLEHCVAVIDDPISSLDSDSLFMVSSFIRTEAARIEAGESPVKQLIILTHNRQFHYESSYSGNGDSKQRRYYRILKRLDKPSIVVADGLQSRVRGSYSSLWQSVVDAATGDALDESVPAGLENIARRIVEEYFRNLGRVSLLKSDLQDAPLAARKFAFMFYVWANSGSHTIMDDVEYSSDVAAVEVFLKSFREFFRVQGHIDHFEMMVASCVGGKELLKDGEIFGPDVEILDE